MAASSSATRPATRPGRSSASCRCSTSYLTDLRRKGGRHEAFLRGALPRRHHRRDRSRRVQRNRQRNARRCSRCGANAKLAVRVVFSYFAQKRGKNSTVQGLTQLLPMGFGDGMLEIQRHRRARHLRHGMYSNDKPTGADREQFYRAARWAAQNGMTLTQHWHGDDRPSSARRVQTRRLKFPIRRLRWSVAHLNDASEDAGAHEGAGWAGALPGARCTSTASANSRPAGTALSRMPPMRTALRVGLPVGAGTDAHR